MSTTASRPAGSTKQAYESLIKLAREARQLNASLALLHWDQEVKMPAQGVDYRSKQISQLARITHETATDPRIGDLLGECESDSSLTSDPLGVEAVNIRELRRVYDRATKLPAELIEEEARLSSVGQHTWARARRNSDFSEFKPILKNFITLLRRKAECFGWDKSGEPWDALAEDYEPGCTAADVEKVFIPLRDRLGKLLDDLMGSANPPSDAFNTAVIPIENQRQFVRFVAESIGFDFDRGRIDISTHPFCSGTHCNDVRITTRFHENNVNDALGSTMHECGHGIYEQGLLYEHVGTPMGESVSLGIHESQSRMWENQVGRSIAFWKWCYPKLQDHLGDAVKGMSFDDVYGAVNIVKPDFIRVEADEATYNMHIMVRFEIERAIMRGDISVDEIPDLWNAKYKEYLNIDVPNDAKGCLQDIHWSMGSMGYFPTYTFGNLYAAQFFETALDDMPDLYDQFENGTFDALKTWLNTNIHAHGQRYRAAELCEHVTGKPLSADPLLRHLESKLRPIYGV